MVSRICSFDIETATVTPVGSNPHDYRPLGICCAATQLVDIGPTGVAQQQPVMEWHAAAMNGELYDAKMSPDEVRGLVDYLERVAADGYLPLGWNSLAFDFDILAEECQDEHYAKRVAELAMRHYDMAFQQLCSMGYMIGMQAAATGLGLKGKLDGMHGDLAPIMWAKSPDDQRIVLDYVKQDVQTTTDILIASIRGGSIRWISRAGRPNQFNFGKWMTVNDCLKIPDVDASWMSSPRTRESCYLWTRKYLGGGE